MPVYSHYNQAKQDLPMAQKVGACITCSYWQVETPRLINKVRQVGLCVQPELKDYALIVSGSSACNHWAKQNGVGDEAEQYAQQTEAQA